MRVFHLYLREKTHAAAARSVLSRGLSYTRRGSIQMKSAFNTARGYERNNTFLKTAQDSESAARPREIFPRETSNRGIENPNFSLPRFNLNPADCAALYKIHRPGKYLITFNLYLTYGKIIIIIF